MTGEKSKPARYTRDIDASHGAAYPGLFADPCEGREKRALGNAFGLSQFGVNMVELAPGAWSSQRHWHSLEDEFIYVLTGTPSLVTDQGEQVLEPGMCIGFPAGHENGHHLINHSSAPVQILEVGTRAKGDDCQYPDIDMKIEKRGQGGRFTRRDGTPYDD